MNSAQIHLALNHVPLFLSLLGAIVLIAAMIKKNTSFKSFSLYLLVSAAIFTAPVFLTGEGTEELVEKVAGVNEKNIEQHEDMAKISLVIIAITGFIALAGLVLKKNATANRIILIALAIFSLASFVAMAQTAHLGGLIRHSELNNSVVAGSAEKSGIEKLQKDDDD
ncbi:MAG: DUF2231 domain-containing protein [Chitinophagaceae bacterium]